MPAFPNILTLTFTQDVVLGTGSLTVYDADTAAVYISYPTSAMSVAGAVVTIDISNDFPDNGSWYVLFPIGVFKGALFGADFELSDDSVWRFSITDGDWNNADWNNADWFTN